MCQWIKIKIFPRVGNYTYNGDDKDKFGPHSVVLGELAINVIRQQGSDVFCGFGAYSVQEVVFQAGLYPSAEYSLVRCGLNILRTFTIPYCL